MDKAAAVNPIELTYPTFAHHFSEFIGIGDNGHLWVEGRDCVDLVKEFGSPLYVFSEGQFRHTYRRFRDAFATNYPKEVEILFANKSNNALAIRHIMNQEGAGGDCFGYNEMYLALLAGSDGRKLALNGSNKEPAEIELAIQNGVCNNIDAMDELDMIDETARRLGKEAHVGIRVKLVLEELKDHHSTGVHQGSIRDIVWGEKWGMSYAQAKELTQRIVGLNHLHLHEISFHLSRLDNQAFHFAVMAREMIRWCVQLREDTGWIAPCIDLGGGWTFGRKEKIGARGGVDDERVSSFEEYGKEVCDGIVAECKAQDFPLPKMRIEPGRSISGMAGVAIGTVGAIKDWPEKGRKWVNVDLSGNHVPWITIPHRYHVVPVNKATEKPVETVDIVGPLCTHDILGKERQMPRFERGDLIALLDTGAYAECQSANFNAQCRPATVLVSGREAEVTTERERLDDVVGRYRVPARLLGMSFAS